MATQTVTDDQYVFVIRRDVSGGENNRVHGTMIGDNQLTSSTNADLKVPGKGKKRKGSGLIEDLGDNPGRCAYGFDPAGGTFGVAVMEDTNLLFSSSLTVGGGAGTFTNKKDDFVAHASCAMVKIGESGEGDVLACYMEGNNWFRLDSDVANEQDLGDTNTSPPLSPVSCWYRNRWWILKDNELFWSDAYSSDYSTAFDRTVNAFNMPVGAERAVLGLREAGLICLGGDAVYGINPSSTPEPFDKVEKILDIGCAAGKTAVQVGDDILFLAVDGVRGVFRTLQDKLQMGSSNPISYPLADEFDKINWGSIDKACAIWFDSKYIISLPTNSKTYNNRMWVYYSAQNAWTIWDNLTIASLAKVQIDGQEKLYGIDSINGMTYELFFGNTDNVREFTATQTGNTVTATEGTFEPNDEGKTWRWDGGATNIIESVTDSTHVELEDSQEVEDATSATIGIIEYDEEGKKEDLGYPNVRKVGGNVLVKGLASSGTLYVWVEFDDGGYNYLGEIDLGGNLIDFADEATVTFPINFRDPSIDYKKFHIDSYGAWYHARVRVKEYSQVESDVVERSIVSHLEEYITEEEG